jgi:hypothetical protein
MPTSSYFDEYESGYFSGADKGGGATGKLGYGGDPTRFGPGPNDWTWAYGSPQNFKQSTTGGRVGGGGRVSTGSGNRTTVSSTKFTMPRPTAPTLPTFEMPKVDKRAVAALTQKAAAPGIRSLREQVQAAMGQNYENPNVRRMTLREALQGYGAGLEKVMGGAGSQARQEHQQELNLLAQERQMNYQTQVQASMDAYNKAWSEYLASAEKTTTTTEGDAASGGEWYRTPFGSLRFARPGESRSMGTY